MANIRELGQKVSSLRNMQKVMRAMNMIASIKLRRILGQLASLRKFEEAAMEMAHSIALADRHAEHPLINPTGKPERACVAMFTSDKGLCGSHNNSVQRAAAKLIGSLNRRAVHADAVCIGLRSAYFCRRNEIDVYLSVESNDRTLTDSALREIVGKLVDRVQNAEIQEAYIVYNAFVSTLQQTTRTLRVLPLCSLLPEELPRTLPDFALEPASETFPRDAVSTVLFFILQSILRHSHLSEHAARMTAMDNATINADDLIGRYVAIRNRARQSAITSEIIEIVAGKEALKERRS